MLVSRGVTTCLLRECPHPSGQPRVQSSYSSFAIGMKQFAAAETMPPWRSSHTAWSQVTLHAARIGKMAQGGAYS